MSEVKSQTRGRKRKAEVVLAPDTEVSQPPAPIAPGAEEKSEEKAECVICFEPPTKKGTINCCEHVFCSECILQWSNVTNKCPVCKRVFNSVTTTPPPAPPPQKGKRKRAPPKPKVHKVKNKEQRVEANYGGVGGEGMDFRDIMMMREMLNSVTAPHFTITRGPIIGGVPFPGGMIGPPPARAHGDLLELLGGWEDLDDLDPDYEEGEEEDDDDEANFLAYVDMMSRLGRSLAPPPQRELPRHQSLVAGPGRFVSGGASASASGSMSRGRLGDRRVGEVEVIDLLDDDEEQSGSRGASSSGSGGGSTGVGVGRWRRQGGMRLPVSNDVVDLTQEPDEGATSSSSSSSSSTATVI